MPGLPERNAVLARLEKDDLALLAPHLEAVELPRHMRLKERGKDVPYAYFPDAGIASVLGSNLRGSQLEVGLVGWDGATGFSALLGDGRAPFDVFMQVAGYGRRIEADCLRALMDQSKSLRTALLCQVQSFVVQMAHTAVAHGRSTIPERLARWLLMAHDRVEGDEVPITHEFLAIMLGVRRPGVTVALKQLEERGPIRRDRSTVVILDRAGLEEAANGAYGSPEAEAKRLFKSV